MNTEKTPLTTDLQKLDLPVQLPDMPSDSGTIDLNQSLPCVLYFYPKDNTPGCSLEAADFNRHLQDFAELGYQVFGVSRDSAKSHCNFKTKQDLHLTLLSDSDEQLCQIFGVIKQKKMYGKDVRGIERSTFIIDSHKAILKAWRGVKVPNHVNEVLAYLRSL